MREDEVPFLEASFESAPAVVFGVLVVRVELRELVDVGAAAFVFAEPSALALTRLGLGLAAGEAILVELAVEPAPAALVPVAVEPADAESTSAGVCGLLFGGAIAANESTQPPIAERTLRLPHSSVRRALAAPSGNGLK